MRTMLTVFWQLGVVGIAIFVFPPTVLGLSIFSDERWRHTIGAMGGAAIFNLVMVIAGFILIGIMSFWFSPFQDFLKSSYKMGLGLALVDVICILISLKYSD